MEQSMERINRINELYKKQKTVGLSEAEKEEQARLRKEYLAVIRENMRQGLNSISIVEADGSVTDLGKKFGGKTGGQI